MKFKLLVPLALSMACAPSTIERYPVELDGREAEAIVYSDINGVYRFDIEVPEAATPGVIIAYGNDNDKNGNGLPDINKMIVRCEKGTASIDNLRGRWNHSMFNLEGCPIPENAQQIADEAEASLLKAIAANDNLPTSE